MESTGLLLLGTLRGLELGAEPSDEAAGFLIRFTSPLDRSNTQTEVESQGLFPDHLLYDEQYDD
jgi:hypothetical protein